jgi:hypothetical protein
MLFAFKEEEKTSILGRALVISISYLQNKVMIMKCIHLIFVK